MVVCVCGGEAADVFCKEHGLLVYDRHDGNLEDYHGDCPVVVTDQPMTREAYEGWKCNMFNRGVELISTRWSDDDDIVRLLHERKRPRGGRQRFGFYRKNGEILENPEQMEVARRVIALRDKEMSYREIREAEGIRHIGGKKLSVSLIQVIIKNRDKYEKG